MDYLFEGPNAYRENLVSVISITSFGPLAPFNIIGASEDYFAFFNSTHDEIDINGPFRDAELAPAPFPDLRDSELYGCGLAPADPVCVHDFVPPSGPTFGHIIGGTLQCTAETVPEGNTWLCLLGGVGLGLLGMLARKYCSGLPPG